MRHLLEPLPVDVSAVGVHVVTQPEEQVGGALSHLGWVGGGGEEGARGTVKVCS